MKGEIVCEFPVNKTPPRNSNGAFATLRDGRIMFAYNRSIGAPNSDVESCIACAYSYDQGITWTQPRSLFSNARDRAVSMISTSFMRLLDGNLAIFYTIHRNAQDLRLHMRISADEGVTWSQERGCIPRTGYFVTNNDRMVRLSSGRLLSAGSYHDQDDSVVDPDSPVDSYNIRMNAISHFFYSDDDGRNWSMARNAVAINISRSTSGLQEPGIVELYPGIIWGFARTDLGRHYEFFSFDNGYSWTQPEPSRFTGPCSPLAIKRIPRDKSLLAVWNPVPNYISQERDIPQSGRFRLVYSISPDNGVSWREPVILENDRGGEFTHPAIHFTEYGVLLAYDATAQTHNRRYITRLRLIRYDEL